MTPPVFENLELRTLMSAVTLAAGKSAYFDTNGDGVNDGVLVNTGKTAIVYDYESGQGLVSVNITADHGKFNTNLPVAGVGDNNSALDFILDTSKASCDVASGGRTYFAVAGQTSVVEGSVAQFEIDQGDLLNLTTTGNLAPADLATNMGTIGKVYVKNGNLTNAASASTIDSLIISGDILGSVTAVGGINSISANSLNAANIQAGGNLGTLAVNTIGKGTTLNLTSLGKLVAKTIGGGSSITTTQDISLLQSGTISDTTVTTGGGITSLIVDTISGSADGTNINIAKHVGKFQAQTITGGDNGMLNLSFAGGVDTFIAGSIDGGNATQAGGGYASTSININGTVTKFSAGILSGGTATGLGSYATLNVSVSDLLASDGTVLSLGNVTNLTAAGLTGGKSIDGGEAVVNFTISNDLVNGRISQIVGNGEVTPIRDPSVYLNVGHDIIKLVAGTITGGNATDGAGGNAYASVNITAGNDIASLTAGRIDGGAASGDGSMTAVFISAGRDINAITANTYAGGTATGLGAMAGIWVNAGRDIDFIGAGTISGTDAKVAIKDHTVQFTAGGNIGLVSAGRITGGSVTSDGVDAAVSSVKLSALGTYVDPTTGVQSLGDIGSIVAGMVDGGEANGANALSYVKIVAAHDITNYYSDHLFGGQSTDGGFAYVSITAMHDITTFQANYISGETNAGIGGDPAVVVQAYNDIKSFTAKRILAGPNGAVDILAGIDGSGNVSGEVDADGNLVAGSIESLVVGLISGNGGLVNIAAGGSIDSLVACQVISGNGEVNIVAGGDITANIGSVKSWTLNGDNGVQFTAGGAVNDVRNSIAATFTDEDVTDVTVPAAPNLPDPT